MSVDLPIDVQPVLDLRFYERSLRDRSGLGNHARNVGGYWSRIGQIDAWMPRRGTDDSIEIDDAEALRVPGTLAFFGDFRRQADNAWRLASKRSPTVEYDFGMSATAGLFFWLTDSGTSFATVPYVGSSMIVLRHQQGERPLVSIDAGSPVLGNAVSSIVPGPGQLDINNISGSTADLKGLNPLSGVMMFADVLSEARESDLLAWYLTQITPELRTPCLGYQYPGGIQSGDLVWRAAIQTARVSLRDWTAAEELGKSGLTIASGTWRITEDATGRAAECIADGRVWARQLGADALTTRVLDTEGSVTLTKTTTQVQLDATAGAKIRGVELEQP